MSIVDYFLDWARTAPATQRAEATASLARAFLHGELDEDEFAQAERALTLMLDDPSPLVRMALAETLGPDCEAPRHLILSLAADQTDIAACVLRVSPLLIDAELVDLVGGGCRRMHMAAALRRPLSRAVAAAIAEVAAAEAVAALLMNPQARIAAMTLARIVELHGEDAEIRDLLLDRDDLPSSLRQSLVVKLGDALSHFVAARAWIGAERASEIAKDACERATIRLAAGTHSDEIEQLARHLRRTGQVTPAFLMRALCNGETRLFAAALADLADMPTRRVAALIHDRGGNGLRALYARAGLPAGAFPAFAAALDVLDEDEEAMLVSGSFARRVVDVVLERYAGASSEALDHLLALLRRFAAEAAREEARRAPFMIEAA